MTRWPLLCLSLLLLFTVDFAAAQASGTAAAEAHLAAGRLDEAERALSTLSQQDNAYRAWTLMGRLLTLRGKVTEAEAWFMRLIEAYNDGRISDRDAEPLLYVGIAARALGAYQDANQAFRESAEADPTRVETQLEWARLFLEKYDAGHAAECVRDALSHDPRSAEAHALMARVLMEQSFDVPGARDSLREALAINPNLVMAHVSLAGLSLRDMDLIEADRILDHALSINPNDMEALSVKAAVRFLADDTQGFKRAQQEVLKRNPHFSRMYSIIAEYAEWEHRYPELAEMARAALKLNPDDGLAHATLGMNLLRLGDEKAGLQALRDAWDHDRFNVHVYNLLNLFDRTITPHYTQFDATPFRIRLHSEERPALEPYLVPMLHQAYGGMKKRYAFTPAGPIGIEMFADAEHFSVRTTGLPHAGVQGVCFGKVVTAVSPRAGPFNWGQIVWHELAHVFHLQMSKNHVPRWFTEGLAEHETIIARPEWKREDDHTLFAALRADRVPHLSEMNRAFTSARSAEALMTAYYAASLAVGYIVERFGDAKVAAMLRAWGRGLRTEDVFSRELGVSIDEVDRDFRARLHARLLPRAQQFHVDLASYSELPMLEAASAARPSDNDALAAVAAGHLVADDHERAKTVAKQVLARAPHHALAHYVLALVALKNDNARLANACLRAILAQGKDGYDLRLLLAKIALAQQDTASARADLEAAARLDPERAEAWQGLGEMAEQAHDRPLLLRALRAQVDIDQHDGALHLAWMKELATDARWAEVITYGERALFTTPEQPELHALLGDAYARLQRGQDALTELDRALALHHPRPAQVQLSRARAFLSLRQRDKAKAAAREAVTLDAQLQGEVSTLGL